MTLCGHNGASGTSFNLSQFAANNRIACCIQQFNSLKEIAMFIRFKNSDDNEKCATVARISDVISGLADAGTVAPNLAGCGFGVENFFNPASFTI